MSSARLARYVPVVQAFAARVVLFHQEIAARSGLNPTDFKCLRLLAALGAMTAGQLAREVGLTRPALTVIVDRLERHGFLTRMRDTDDRRKVLLHPVPERIAEIDRLYASQAGAVEKILDRYSDAAFDAVLRFMTEVGALLRAQATSATGSRSRARRRSDAE